MLKEHHLDYYKFHDFLKNIKLRTKKSYDEIISCFINIL